MGTNESIHHANEDVVWIQKNRDFLWQNYAGKWIAVKEQKLIAAGNDPESVREEATRKGYVDALITGVRRTEYQAVRMIRRARTLRRV